MIKLTFKRSFTLMLMMLTMIVGTMAEEQFDPKKFEADMEQYITSNAGLTPQEASKFFPVYREMGRKMRSIFTQQRNLRFVDPNDDKACANSISKQDELDVQLKKLQQQYHNKFMKILPASKVYKVIKAEGDFHRDQFRKAAFGRKHNPPKRNK